VRICGISRTRQPTHIASSKPRTDPDFLHATLDRSAYAAFFTESRTRLLGSISAQEIRVPSWEILSRPWRDCSWLTRLPTTPWATLSRPLRQAQGRLCGTECGSEVRLRSPLFIYHSRKRENLDPNKNLFSFDSYGINCNFFLRVLRGSCGRIEGPGMPGTNQFAVFDHPFG
jgi:hypothetical protein